LEALRAVKAAILLEKTKDGNAELTTDSEVALLKRLLKQRRESAEIYLQNNRPELADKESAEAKCIEEFLPKQMSQDEVTAIIKDIIAQLGATSIKDFGKVMKVANGQLAGKADGKLIADIVKSLLA